MKGIRFYLEHNSNKDKRKGNHNGNVFAGFITDGGLFQGTISKGEVMVEGLGALYFEPNSPVCVTSASLSYLRYNCKRISEQQARQIHPKLFERLENE